MSDFMKVSSGPDRMPAWHAVQARIKEAERLRTQTLGRWVARVGAYVRERWIDPARRVRRRRDDLTTLMSLDDRTLDDIGVNRADLQAAAWHGVPLQRLIAKRHESGRANVVPLAPSRPAPAPARALDEAA